MKITLKKIIANQVFKYLVAGVAATLIFFIFKMLTFLSFKTVWHQKSSLKPFLSFLLL